MDQNENQSVITFDTLYTNNHIQILKILLPYFDAQSQKKLAILIKFMELRYTMEYFARHAALENTEEKSFGEHGKQPDIVKIFEQIKNFCTPSERAMFDQLANMKKSMEMYEEMMGMMQLFSQLSPDGGMPFSSAGAKPDAPSGSDPQTDDPSGQSASPFGNANPMDLLKGMLSPEQQTMFEMFQSSFGNTN